MEEKSLPQYLTELVCTRISHDIIGNVGAVANAVELLEEGDLDFLDDIRSILKVSSNVLSSRLKFFRLAFGLSNQNLTDIPTLRKTTEDYLRTLGNASYPINLRLELNSEHWCRFAILLIMILADTLVKGGTIEVQEQENRLIATVQSEHSLAEEKIKNIQLILNGFTPENQAQYAPVVYLQNMLNNNKKLNIIEKGMFGLMIE